jgi:hypothetical protein
MAILDYTQSYKDVLEKIRSRQTLVKLSKDKNDLIKKNSDNLQKIKKDVVGQVEQAKQDVKRYQKEVKNQLDQLIDTLLSLRGGGLDSGNFLKNKMIQTIILIIPKIKKIIEEETLKALGCSAQQTYDTDQVIYIKVKSIDLKKLLQYSPEDENFRFYYEKENYGSGVQPSSVNRMLYGLIQNEGVFASSLFGSEYLGGSQQALFDIAFVTQNELGQSGEYFKIKLKGRANNINTVGEFLKDYYSSIKIIDFSIIIAELINSLNGVFDFNAKVGYKDIEINRKFILFAQRIFGLCFDEKKEIDVSGVSKVSELDGIDESFYQFNQIDLRNIENEISNIQLGQMEFEDCGNLKISLDTLPILDSMNNLRFVEGTTNSETFQNAINDAINSTKKSWQFKIPNDLEVSLTFDLDVVKGFPKAVVGSLLSPKNILPLAIMSKSIQQNIMDGIENLEQFYLNMRRFVKELFSKVFALFVEEFVKIIKKEATRLVTSIISDLRKEKGTEKEQMILSLVNVALIGIKFIRDYRRCKSVVDEILQLLDLARVLVRDRIPSPLLAISGLLPGTSSLRSMTNVIENFQKLGLPTGDLPDGSTNLMLQSILAQFQGMNKEKAENGKTQVFIPALPITPAFLTVPTGSAFGKYF